ncbi:hypothetical protein BRW65_05130 [Mycobacterium paraffinicum]|uniref:Uncharacterized protein n=2 Tax=Mycobacterium paraffinicum TaxID=53378 RepID=A0A1Q4HZS0_9MYCO|nr:hypothetical protein BRW65_05130 [Mycobacterium paraffinicum]
MTRRRCAALLVAALTALGALMGGAGMAAGVALASPDPGQQPDISDAIDEWPIEFPSFLTNPVDESGLAGDWGGVGMWCNNLHANCA